MIDDRKMNELVIENVVLFIYQDVAACFHMS